VLLYSRGFTQTGSKASVRFDFNDHQLKEVNNRVSIKPIGVTLTEDRFGNPESAVYLQGNSSSYINLGSAELLKPKTGTIAMWVNIQEIMYGGKGYNNNPLIIVKNGPGEDFTVAYTMVYNFVNKRFSAQNSIDSIREVTLTSKDTIVLNTWYHLLITFDYNHFSFYMDGRLQGKLFKGFETKFLDGDSVMLGRTTGSKNQRYARAIVDDICFYDHVLNKKEIQELYHEPNPNRLNIILTEIVKYGSIIFILGMVIVILLIRNKRNLKRQKEYYELNNRIKELEARAIRAQMNPHFISNSMAAIQSLIYHKEYTKASQYLAKSTFLMRQVLDLYDKTYISLEEELSFIKLNLELEQLRFDHDFNFNLIIEEGIDLKEVIIPSLITQPIVENAIWHGLLPLKERIPKLDLHVYTKNNITFIAIEDNGIGRSNPGTEPETDSKGIKLITDKIESINRLRNSIDFKLEIIDLFDENNLPIGTKIIIQLLNYTLEE
jgi:hypothetical protein